MGFALPSGVVNTDAVYVFADTTLTLAMVTKQPADQTLVVVDYSNLTPPVTVSSYTFTIDVTSNPALVVSYPQIDVAGRLVFLVSGGIAGQQYNLSIAINSSGTPRTDTLTINIPSSGECDCDTINPVPTLYSQLPLGEPTQGYANTAVRYFWGTASPSAPNVMDQWYNPGTSTLYEWVTDGTKFFWQTMMSASLVSEAPLGTTYYSRYNGYWAPNPIQGDAPNTGLNYARVTGGWVASIIQNDAPDAQLYSRSKGAWVLNPPATITTDAPDAQLYSRSKGAWVLTPIYPITADAPDSNAYLRTRGAWASGGTLTGALVVTGNLSTSANLSVGGNLQVTGVATFGAQVALAYDPVSAMQAATKEYVDNSITNAFNVNGSPFLRLAGGVMNGPITLSADPAAPLQPVTLQYFNAHSAAGLTDAPADGTTYARQNHLWVNVLALTGGTLTGALILAAPPTLALGAATKGYVDNAIATVIPSPSGSPPPMDGIAAAGVSAAYARADHVHQTDTSLYPMSNPSGYQTAAQISAALGNYYPNNNPAGYQTAAQVTAALGPYALISSVPVSSNVAPLIDGVAAPGSATTWSRGDHVHPTDTSRASVTQLSNYLPLTGGTLTGILTLSANPVGNLDAATKQYVDNAVIDCGTF